jgi:beta-phosphoglucomutase-like phosphatase (HAD superfamily)
MSRIRALCIDLDGTLANSLSVMREAYGLFMTSQGKIATDSEFEEFNGVPMPKILSELRSRHSLADDEATLWKKYIKLLDQRHVTAPPHAGARELLEKARLCGIKAAVVTSSAMRQAERWLAYQGLEGLISRVIAGDTVAHGKPNPEPYIKALELLDCNADHAMAIEDSALGLQSAIGAGIKTFHFDPGRTGGKLTLMPNLAGTIHSLSEAIAKFTC